MAAAFVGTPAHADEKPPPPGTGNAGNCGRYVCLGASSGKDDEDQVSTGTGKGGKVQPSCPTSKLTPQPPAGSNLWGGRDPSDGDIYVRRCAEPTQFGSQIVVDYFFAAQPPPAVVVDPEVLAQEAVDKMLLEGVAIRTAPKAGTTGVVGVPAWFWSETSPTTTGPNTASASAGAVTVTATAKVTKVVWTTGDGSSVTCAGPGTPYKKAYGMKESPTCGHTYVRSSATEPGDKFQVTATSTWTVDWEVVGGGETGVLTEIRESEGAVAIGELQSVGD
ncbi:ATP/GTP-binding protein [Streptomyces sp. N35]|uniref:ATP/GTP-binding protein n=1 Tax=Streptomyces sp. N35 TaxID=2795730 RepID=UPI001F29D54A|nr:ATP/GTP-binding protein [Streptomyces sp. N35]